MWNYLLVIFIALVMYYLYKQLPWFYKVQFVMQRALADFCVEKPHCLLGHLLIFRGINEAGMMQSSEWTNRSKSGAHAFLLPMRAMISLGHPDTIKKILKTAEPKGFIPASGTSYTYLVPWLGDGLLTSSGTKWFRSRRLLTPGFHFDVLKPYMNIFNECTNNLILKLNEDSSKKISTDVFSAVSLCTLNVILKCAFSAEEQIQTKGERVPYVKAVNGIANLVMERIFSPSWGLDFLYDITPKGRKFNKLITLTHDYTSRVIQNRRDRLNQGLDPTKTKKYIDFLDILLLAKDENGQGLSDVEILDEVETFMFEGHDTTASGISFIFYNLARHPKIQKKAQKEIDSLLEGRANDDIQWEDMAHLHYLTMCIKESIRLHPPVPAVYRELTKPLEIDGKSIPAGTIVEANMFNVHHNPKVWGENYMTYDPERFLPDNCAKMDPYAFIPFSAGPRNCIGQVFAMNELKTTVAKILYKFDISVDTSVKVLMKTELVLKTENGMKLYFTPRSTV